MLWKFVSALIQDTKQNNINILYCFASQDIHLLCKVQHSVQWWIYDWIRQIGVGSWLQNWHLMKLTIWSTDPNQQQKISGEDESIWWERFIGGLVGAEVGRGGGDCLASTAAKGLLILLLLLLLVLVLLLLLLSSWQLASSGGPASPPLQQKASSSSFFSFSLSSFYSFSSSSSSPLGSWHHPVGLQPRWVPHLVISPKKYSAVCEPTKYCWV